MKILYRFAIAATTVGLGVASVKPASAFTFDFSYNLGGFDNISGNAILSASDTQNSDGSYTVNGITGTTTINGDSQTITGLLPTDGFTISDNLYIPGQANVFDSNGLSYALANGTDVNISGDSSGYSVIAGDVNGNGRSYVAYGPLTSVSVPEPLSVGGTIFAAGIGLLIKRKQAISKIKA